MLSLVINNNSRLITTEKYPNSTSENKIMTSSSSPMATMRRKPATGRPGGPLVSSQRSQTVRMNLFVLVRILFQYLERVDSSVLHLAKEVLKDCERKHNTKDSKYGTLADAIGERVRDAVGEAHWAQARKIQKQLALNQQKKKLAAMKGAAKRNAKRMDATPAQSRELNSSDPMNTVQSATRPVSQDRMQQRPQQEQHQQARRLSTEEAMEAAKAMSALSQTPSGGINLPPRAPASLDQDMTDGSSVATPTAGNVMPSKTNSNEAALPASEPAAVGGGSSSLPFRKRIMFASSQQQGNNTAPKFGSG